MKERPIPMQPDMARATWEDRKTQTRRLVKLSGPFGDLPIIDSQGPHMGYEGQEHDPPYTWTFDHLGKGVICVSQDVKCPYGKPGDRLWVKEKYSLPYVDDHRTPTEARENDRELNRTSMIWYEGEADQRMGRWRVPRFMPRWASCQLLDVIEIRAQQIQEITSEDAIAEGIWDDVIPPTGSHPPFLGYGHGINDGKCLLYPKPQDAFEKLWDSINAKRGHPWSANDWVWAITYKRIKDA